jgi:hypothetical protein
MLIEMEEVIHIILNLVMCSFYLCVTLGIVIATPGTNLSIARDRLILESQRHSYFHRILPIVLIHVLSFGLLSNEGLQFLAALCVVNVLLYLIGLAFLRRTKLQNPITTLQKELT